MKQSRALWLLTAATFLWGSAELLAASDGGMSVLEYLSYFYGGLFFGAAGVAVGALVVIRNIRRRVSLDTVLPLPVTLQVAFLAVVFLGVSFDVAFRARFRLSRSVLQSAVDDIRSGRREPGPGWIGLFRVREVDTPGSSVRFITDDSFFDDCGFAYSPAGEPPVVGEDSYSHISGPWWRWNRSW
jgi:hypothetical protein